jgi:uncharacterized protein (DUF2225 family)
LSLTISDICEEKKDQKQGEYDFGHLSEFNCPFCEGPVQKKMLILSIKTLLSIEDSNLF